MNLTIDTRDVEVRKFAHQKRSNLMRSAARASRAGPRNATDLSRPRNDAQIMWAWLARAIRRSQGIYLVGEPEWRYEPDFMGEGAKQIAFVRVVMARDEYERKFFERGIRVAPGTNVLQIPGPPERVAVYEP